MKLVSVVTSSVIIWVLIFLIFTVMSFIPILKDSELIQNLILYILLIPIVVFGTKYYYKKEQKTHGLIIGATMATIGLLLDSIITVPYVIIPHGGTYASFFINPLLWITTIEFILIAYFYWNLKENKSSSYEK